jgi:hypothetical protein
VKGRDELFLQLNNEIQKSLFVVYMFVLSKTASYDTTSYKRVGGSYCFHFGVKQFFPEDGGTFSVETSVMFYPNTCHDTQKQS